MGTAPSSEALRALGLPSLQTEGGDHQQQDAAVAHNPFAAILPLPTATPQGSESKDKAEGRPTRYLVAKGLPT